MGIVTLQVGNLALDAFQAWDHTASDPVQVKTDTYVPDPQCDYNWNMTFLYDMVTNVGTAQFCDAGTHNQHGPAILCLKSGAMETGAWVDQRPGNPVPMPYLPQWSVAAAGPAAPGLASLPVLLLQNLSPDTAYLAAANPPVNQALTIAVTEESAATVWTLAPVTPPLAAWRHFPIQEGSEVTVEGALTQIWNHMVGTGWASSLAPAVLSWMYDFPAWYPDQSTWRAQLNDVLCPSVWVPYFVQGNSGFGDGDPPAAQPLPPR